MGRFVLFSFFIVLGGSILFGFDRWLSSRPPTNERLPSSALKHFHPPAVIRLDFPSNKNSTDEVERWVLHTNKVQLELLKPQAYQLQSVKNKTIGFTATIFSQQERYLTDYIPLTFGDNEIYLEWENKAQSKLKRSQSIWLVFQSE
ncbi:MAG: hypothetical protein RMK80_04085 [Pseudobdellovibrionaceae bacterium]|nr:hypothetical protein [Pseudobdellovibrionaceae bacterium]